MVSPINWLRILIICLAPTSLSIGFYLRGQREFPDILTIMLATDIVVVFLYAEFVYKSSVEDQFRGWRILLRFILAFMTVYGPATALDRCNYFSIRDYSEQSPGFHTLGHINCILNSYDAKDKEEIMLPLFRLFRVRCIITATVCVLIFVELCCYAWSQEGRKRARVSVEAETRNDVELGYTSSSVGESQKTMVSDDPLHATA